MAGFLSLWYAHILSLQLRADWKCERLRNKRTVHDMRDSSLRFFRYILISMKW